MNKNQYQQARSLLTTQYQEAPIANDGELEKAYTANKSHRGPSKQPVKYQHYPFNVNHSLLCYPSKTFQVVQAQPTHAFHEKFQASIIMMMIMITKFTWFMNLLFPSNNALLIT